MADRNHSLRRSIRERNDMGDPELAGLGPWSQDPFQDRRPSPRETRERFYSLTWSQDPFQQEDV